MDSDRFDELLADEVRASLERAKTVEAGDEGLPRREVVVLRRVYGSLQPATEHEIDWRLALVVLTRVDRLFWERMVDVTARLSEDQLVEETIGWNRDPTS